MKWNGIVSQCGVSSIAARFTAAKTAHASSTQLRRQKPISDIANGLDGRVRPQLLAQPPNADVDDVGARVEVVAPHAAQQLLAADHLARVLAELVQQAELALGQLGDAPAQAHL